MEILYSFVSMLFLYLIWSNPSLCSKHESDANEKLGKLEKTAGNDRLNSLIDRRVNVIVAEKVQLALSQLVCSYQ